jgi:hypothetical protein
MADGCTGFIDGWWRACCDEHDQAYLDNTVTLWTHLELGWCVAFASEHPLLMVAGLLIGLLMAAATTLWWLIRR